MSKVLMDSLKEYNEMNAEMDLVLFEDAMKHVAVSSTTNHQPSNPTHDLSDLSLTRPPACAHSLTSSPTDPLTRLPTHL